MPARETHGVFGTGCGQMSSRDPLTRLGLTRAHPCASSTAYTHPWILRDCKSTEDNILAALTCWIVPEHQVVKQVKQALLGL